MTLFARNLAKCGKSLTVEDRTNRIINNTPQEVFSNPRTVTGIVKTVEGITVFDSTNIERIVTHEICIPYQAGIGAEQWVRFKSKLYRILAATNCCENDEVLILYCTERGDESVVGNTA